MSQNKTNIVPATPELLKTLDLVLIIDHSGSMGSPSNRLKGKTRYQEMQEEAYLAANVMGQYDSDGITLIHFANYAKVTDGVKPEAVAQLFKETVPGGGTNLHLALEQLWEKVKTSTKEVVAIIWTDGEASDPEEVISSIKMAGAQWGRPKVGMTIVQVGNDQGAKDFLDKLDNDLKVDIVAVFNEEEAEGLTIEQLIYAARTE